MFTLFAIAFFLIGVILFGIGLVGEYVGRIYQQVRARPRYLVQTILEQSAEQPCCDASEVRAGPRTAHGRARTMSTRAVVFAYHNVGVRCLQVRCSRAASTCRWWSRTRTTRREASGSTASRKSCREHGIRVHHAGTIRKRRELLAAVQRRAARLSSSRSTTATCCRRALLALAARGAYNMHGSLLPKYRGRVPVNWAVLHGETETGATLHYMAAQARRRRHRGADRGADPARRHRLRGVRQGGGGRRTDAVAACCRRCWPGTAPQLPNDLARGSYFGGRKPEDGRIDWTPAGAGDPQPDSRGGAAVSRRLHRLAGQTLRPCQRARLPAPARYAGFAARAARWCDNAHPCASAPTVDALADPRTTGGRPGAPRRRSCRLAVAAARNPSSPNSANESP